MTEKMTIEQAWEIIDDPREEDHPTIHKFKWTDLLRANAFIDGYESRQAEVDDLKVKYDRALSDIVVSHQKWQGAEDANIRLINENVELKQEVNRRIP